MSGTEKLVVIGGISAAIALVIWEQRQQGHREQLTYHMVARGDTQVNLGAPHGVAGPGVFIYGPASNHQVGQAPGLL